MDGDIPLREAQIIWDYHGDKPDMPPVRVMGCPAPGGKDRWGNRDDGNYFSSWGACMEHFNAATDEGRLLLLFQQYHWMVLSREVDPKSAHEALLMIPEYRAALPTDFLPEKYRAGD